MQQTAIAVIGLGTMGGPIAANLVKAGHTVLGVDLSEGARERAAATGVQVVASAAEAAREVDATLTMLPAGQHVREAFDGPEGIWANARSGSLLIDASTVDVGTSRWCHEGSAARGFRFVDAPVSGGVPGAQAGTLTAMLGGEPEAVAVADVLLAPAAARRIDAGGPTRGTAAKICNNMMLFSNLVATCEGAQLAQRLGLDPAVFYEIATTSSGRSFPLETWYPVPGVVDSSPANRGYAPDFPATGALKDVDLALNAGRLAGVNLPAAALAASQFQQLIDEGLGDLDCSLIAKFVSPDGTAPGFVPRDKEQS